jgi:DNA-directed RNA polymerase alpha subunit
MRGRPSQKLFRKLSDKEKNHFSNFGRPKDAIRKKKKVTDEDKKEKIGQYEDLNFCVMNVNSMHSEEKEKLGKLGIAES